MQDLQSVRSQIDAIDNQLVELYKQRMSLAEDVAEIKREAKLPVLDRERERAKIYDLAHKVTPELRDSLIVLIRLLMEASRSRQHHILDAEDPLVASIQHAVESTDDLFPEEAYIACQGVEGAYSQIAADKLFRCPSISYFDTFDSVFHAVEEGFCRYGILPLENSTAGSVNQIYDLMMQYNFHIVRSVRVKIDHHLLALPGTRLQDLREIYSHQQAISQSQSFLSKLDNVEVHVCDNTAMAAKMVAELGRNDVAALSSRSCIDLYGLVPLVSNVQDKANNYTRFVCVSKELEIYPGANRTSLMIVVSHYPGALCQVLTRFYALDINLSKLESRPLPDRDFEFMFFFDLEAPVGSSRFISLLTSLGDVCEQFRYLGSYSELV